MKTNRIVFLFLMAIGVYLAGCEGLLSDLLKFNTEWYTVEFSIDTTCEPGDITFITDTIAADLDSLLDENGLSPENIESIRLSDAKIYVLTNGVTFDPVTRAELLIETEDLSEKRIAWLDTVPPGETMVELDLTDDDLKDYVLEDEFIFTVRGHLESKVDQKINMKANFRYIIQGDITE